MTVPPMENTTSGSFAMHFSYTNPTYEKRIKRQKYYAFRTAVESYNEWKFYKECEKEYEGKENLLGPEEILKKLGCYTLIMSLLEDRIKVYFWWVSYHDQQKLIETNGEFRCASEQEFLQFSLEPTRDKTFQPNRKSSFCTITPILITLKRLLNKNYFEEEHHGKIRDFFQQRNKIIHDSHMNHNEITLKLVEKLFDEFRLMDSLVKKFQRECRQKKKMKISSSS